jgi:hypothetical protein
MLFRELPVGESKASFVLLKLSAYFDVDTMKNVFSSFRPSPPPSSSFQGSLKAFGNPDIIAGRADERASILLPVRLHTVLV